ncbi:MAG: cyclic nucleotide-binding domain-containing protein [Phormidium sp. BM_Day4_Bin.17]|nr:cyclic nucleotide-binding domain-containing protein [Phormidium sp. BM_Day4_Bin.17]UCJ13362.1 MAG: cyclic nucleotide-binding domain-containing protein [Phormidium sp. PBR-2020]
MTPVFNALGTLKKRLWMQSSKRFSAQLSRLSPGNSSNRLLHILALAAMIMALNVISYTLASSLFVSNIGAAGLPLSYILVGLASSPIYGWFSQIVDRIPHRSLFRYWALLTGSVMLGLRALLFWDIPPIYYALYVGVYFLWTLQLDILLPTLISDYFTSREYKRIAPYITVCQAIGGFIGGLIVGVLANLLSTADILLLVPTLYLVVFALVWNLQRQEQPVPPEESDRHADSPPSNLPELLRQYPIFKWLAGSTFLWIVLYGIAEYLYFDAYAQHFADHPQRLTAFLGGFSAINSILQVLVLLLITRRLLIGRVGVDGTNPIYPITTALAFLGLSFGFGVGWAFPAALFAHFNSSTIDTAVNQPVYTLMYNPIPNRDMAKVRALTDGLCYALGLATTGGLLWFAQSYLDPMAIALFGTGLSLLFVLIRRQLSRDYFQSMVTRLFSNTGEMDLEMVEELFSQVPDSQIPRLKALLREGQPQEQEKALRLAVGLRVPSQVLEEIKPLVFERELPQRRALFRFFAKTPQDKYLSRFLWQLLESPEVGVKLLAFESLVARGESFSDSQLTSLLESPAATIQGLACVLAQQSTSLAPQVRERCRQFWDSPLDDETKTVVIRGIRNLGDVTMIPQLRSLLEGASVDVQIEGLKGLAQLQPERDLALAELATGFLDHPNPVVRGAAVDLLGAVQLEEFWPDIARGLEDRDITVRGQAIKALARYEDYNLDRLAEMYLNHPRIEVAESAVAVLATVKTSRAFQFLESYLQADYRRAALIRDWWQRMPQESPQWEPLVGVFRDRTQRVVNQVFHVLSCLGNRRTLAEVRQLLQRGEKRDRDNALETLETLPHRRYVFPIVPLIEDPDGPVSSSQVSAEVDSLALLQEMFDTEDHWIRAGALRVWVSYQQELPSGLLRDRDRVVKALITEINKSQGAAHFSFDRILFLKTLVLFQELSLDDLWSLDRGFQKRTYSAGETICEEGELGKQLSIVYQGHLQANSSFSEEPIVLTPGTYFGDFGLFGETPYSATITAETDSLLLCLSKDSFDVLVDVIPKLNTCLAIAARYSSL